MALPMKVSAFLSSNAQDFIEERRQSEVENNGGIFLSSNAQDFIEDSACTTPASTATIPEQ